MFILLHDIDEDEFLVNLDHVEDFSPSGEVNHDELPIVVMYKSGRDMVCRESLRQIIQKLKDINQFSPKNRI